MENLFAASQGLNKQESFRKHFILMCRFTMSESTGGGGGGGGERTDEREKEGSKGIFLKNHTYLLVFILARHCYFNALFY